MSHKSKELLPQDLTINKQLRVIMPNLTPEDKRALDASLVQGDVKPVIVWNDMVLQGFDVLEICRVRGVPLKVKQLPCSNLDEAIEWACTYAFRNITICTEAYKKYWIGLRYLSAKKNRRSTNPQIVETDEYDHVLNIVRQNRTIAAAASEFDISIGTFQKYGAFAKAINSIMSKNPVMGLSILQERIHVSHTNLLLLEQLNAKELRRVNYRFDLGGVKIIGISPESSSPPMPKPTNQPGIKMMPEYDPDAEFAGLLLTAKTWISSLERTYRLADFKNASARVKKQAMETLLDLRETIDVFCLSLEEDRDGQ